MRVRTIKSSRLLTLVLAGICLLPRQASAGIFGMSLTDTFMGSGDLLADIFVFAGNGPIFWGESGYLIGQNLETRMPGLKALVEIYAQPDSVPLAEVAPEADLGVATESTDGGSTSNPAQEIELVAPPVVSPSSP